MADDTLVDAVLVHNMSRGGRLHFAGDPVQLPKAEANDMLRRGAVRKPTKEEKETIRKRRDAENAEIPDEPGHDVEGDVEDEEPDNEPSPGAHNEEE
jgi:hypothetical protein